MVPALAPLVIVAFIALATVTVGVSILPSATIVKEVALAAVTSPPKTVSSTGVAAEFLPDATLIAKDVAAAAVITETELSV